MNKSFNKLKVLRGLEINPVINFTLSYSQSATPETYNDLLYEIYSAGAENAYFSYVQNCVLHDENAFSVTCAGGADVSDYLKCAYLHDLKIIFEAALNFTNSSDFRFGKCLPLFDCGNDSLLIYKLENFYRENGYGNFIDSKAFTYRNDKFVPMTNLTETGLSDLKDYCDEKELIENNFKNFINGLPFSHMLLYGDRGTGKSSTVHAMFNKYCNRGLRLIEINPHGIDKISDIRQKTASLKLKFLLFIDDLALAENDERASVLKSAIEGTAQGGGNVMIAATSNRRHIVNEKFTDRENSVHKSDNIEEQLSLSDRFGLTVLFSSTDKACYLSIVDQLAADRGITLEVEKLKTLAERWAILNGGRSPRRAKQFTDFVFACQKSGRPVDF